MSTQPIPLRGPKVQHDGLITIATGASRTSKQWKNKELLWSALLQNLSEFTVTPETLAEYQAMPKPQRDEIKDVGGFVGGALKAGRRKASSVEHRQLITLDADDVKGDLWEALTLLCDYAVAVYSTHSHTPERPRLRLVIPLARPVSPEEYQAVSRRVAGDLDINQFDPTTFEAHRLMYWPSCSKDATPVFEYHDAPWLDPDKVLARYPDWRDPSYWPEPERASKDRKRLADKAEDPHAKGGVVGAFCRTYSIEDAIETFLPDVYVETEGQEGRYTYVEGSTTGGLVIYEDGKFAYSHHGTDPISGQLVNAFDLVRIHKFGDLDDEAKDGTPTVRLPSYLRMLDLAINDNKVKKTLVRDKADQIAEDFGEPDDEDTSWLTRLSVNKKGAVESTRQNIQLILENDPRLKGRIATNEFTGLPAVRGRLPWREIGDRPYWSDLDEACLRCYLEKHYGIDHVTRTRDAIDAVLTDHTFHPVRDYLNGLEWDGEERLDTLFVDMLGAEDGPYTRSVTRKSLVAAVARAFKPGCKFDNMVVLIGGQGIGKSMLLHRLGREWFSDSLTTMIGKEAYEQLRGIWIMEVGELAAVRKAADVEAVKNFISKQEDIYRAAYERRTSTYPRQCVFFGTTNKSAFLVDATGNRRFWPLVCHNKTPSEALMNLTDETVDQIWAEAVIRYREGETLFLEGDLAEEAKIKQEEHRDETDLAGVIREYLDLPLPYDWETRSLGERRDYINGNDFGEPERIGKPRDRVCSMEIWVELLGKDRADLTRARSNEIVDILRNTPGWVEGPKQRFGVYGPQKAFVRAVPSTPGMCS